MAKLKVKQVRSVSGSNKRQRLTLKGLGLRRHDQEVTIKDTPATRGMIRKVSHLVEVEEIEE